MVLAPERFLAQSFGAALPPVRLLVPDDALLVEMQRVLGKPYPLGRLRYWHRGQRSAWLLEQTGRDHLITAGFVVEGGAGEDGGVGLPVLRQASVLIYRESRGWEIKHPRFLRQYEGLRLQSKQQRLSRRVNGISGATLSVNAMNRMARLALLLHGHIAADASPATAALVPQ